MGDNSPIQWNETTWHPTTGCSKVSRGCANCYAEREHFRLEKMGQAKYQGGFKQLRTHQFELARPKRWTRGRMIFVNSMSDIFHADIPEIFIMAVWAVMNECPQHQFQVLTKRTDRMVEMAHKLTWTPNIWMGVSVEDHRVIGRVKQLQRVPAFIRFISAEPLVNDIGPLNLEGIQWLIAGGESGPRCAEMDLAWPRNLLRQCREQHVAFFMKQLGGVWNKRGKLEDLPEDLRVREFPWMAVR